MIYLISYDLQLFKNYDALYGALNGLGAQRILLSQWVVRLNSTAAEIRDHLLAYLDADDRLLVCALVGNSAWYCPLVDLNAI